MPEIGTIEQISPGKLQSMLGEDSKSIQLLDVRTPLEFDSVHLSEAKNLPLSELTQKDPGIEKDRPLVIICRSGTRAGRAATLLSSYGFNSLVLEGGMLAWQKSRFPVIEGKKRLSLERQVQLTIGLILLTSVLSGFLFSKYFFILPAFIGAGLTFAGLTGNCGLAILLARAPWNKLDSNIPNDSQPKASCCSND